MRILGWSLIALSLLLGFVFSFGEPLGAVIHGLESSLIPRLQAGVQRNLLPWMWDLLMLPILERPVWVTPMLAGCLVFLLRWIFGRKES